MAIRSVTAEEIWVDVDFDHQRVALVAEQCDDLAQSLRSAADTRDLSSDALIGAPGGGWVPTFRGLHAMHFRSLHAMAVQRHRDLADAIAEAADRLRHASVGASMEQSDRLRARVDFHESQLALQAATAAVAGAVGGS